MCYPLYILSMDRGPFYIEPKLNMIPDGHLLHIFYAVAQSANPMETRTKIAYIDSMCIYYRYPHLEKTKKSLCALAGTCKRLRQLIMSSSGQSTIKNGLQSHFNILFDDAQQVGINFLVSNHFFPPLENRKRKFAHNYHNNQELF